MAQLVGPGDATDSDSASVLDKIYDGARELFLVGEYDRALDRFQSIYEIDMFFRDVADIVGDYYFNISKEEWIAKYQALFQGQRGTA